MTRPGLLSLIALLATGSGCSSGGEQVREPTTCRPGGSSAQFRAQTLPPEDMTPGTRASVSVTFENCSGKTWSRSEIALRPHDPLDAATWRVVDVALPHDVLDGETVTLPFEITAPHVPGVYPFTWTMEGAHVGRFAEASPRADVTVRHSADCTKVGPPVRFRAWTVPSFVAAGETVRATATFANCSTSRWSSDDGFALGSQAEADNKTWGRSRIAFPFAVPSQSTATVPIEVTAPTVPGAYHFAWRVVQEGVGWLDEGTPVVTIHALERFECTKGAPSRFVREDVPPAEVNPGEAIRTRITFANCSNEIWRDAFSVGAAAPSNDAIFGAGTLELPFPVAPGFAITVGINGRAPSAPGTYPYRWTIRQSGVGAVDEPSPQHSVRVRCIPSCGDHTCGGDGCGGSCGACASGYVCDGAYCRVDPSTVTGYRMPFACGVTATISQGNYDSACGAYSHTGVSAYAYDYAVPLNTRVHAMKGGVVSHVRNDIKPGHPCYSGGGSGCINSVNYITIRHNDGYSTTYVHLNDALVGPGQSVAQGQLIGLSGGTGWSTGPHMHVQKQVNCGVFYCQSVPLVFDEASGRLDCGRTLTSRNGC